jgi:sporulation protein YlmC with PRC-barrel domain
MRINSRHLTGLPVVTRSGRDLGRVGSFDVDADSGRLVTLRVKTRGFVKGLLDAELLISWPQVESIDERRVTVSDGSVPALASSKAERGARELASRAAGAPSGVLLADPDAGRNEEA